MDTAYISSKGEFLIVRVLLLSRSGSKRNDRPRLLDSKENKLEREFCLISLMDWSPSPV